MARASCEYVHFKKTPSIDTYVRKSLERLTKRFKGSWGRATVKLRAMVSARAPEGYAKEFMAELFIRRPRMAPVVVKKKSADLRTAVHQAISAAERVVE